jgi:TPR repeat protein
MQECRVQTRVYEKGVNLGCTRAMLLLGCLCIKRGDVQRGMELLYAAANLHDPNAFFLLAKCHDGSVPGGKKDKMQAMRMYQRAADLGHKDAKKIIKTRRSAPS